MAVTIEPLGGLGNQLFVYAAGRSLSLDLGTPLLADLQNFEGYEWHKYELDSFRNALTVIPSARRWLGKECSESRSTQRARRFLNRVAWRRSGIFTEKSFVYNPEIREVQDGATLRGYFQSWKYFEEHAAAVRADVLDIVSPSNWFLETKSQLDRLGPWIAIHVRRGNYVGLPNMGLVEADYYLQSLLLMTELEGTLKLVVFSDDPKAAVEILGPDVSRNALVIDAPHDSRPIESLLLLSRADHIIMANSTFSWWAAWLNDRQGRRVICPRPWLDDSGHNDRDLVPAPWISIVRRTR